MDFCVLDFLPCGIYLKEKSLALITSYKDMGKIIVLVLSRVNLTI